MSNYQWIWQYAKKYSSKAILAIIFLVVNAILIVINPLITGEIVDKVIDGNQPGLLVPFLALMIGITLFRTIIRYLYQMLFERIGQNTLYELRQDMYKKLQELDFDFFNHTRVGDIMARMTGDTDAIRHFVSWVVYNILECVLWFVTAVVVMATINWQLMLALVAVTPFIFILTQRMSKEAHPVFFEIRESFSRLNSMVEENIGGNRVVKAFAREEFEIEKFNEHNEDYKKRNMESAKISRKYLPWLDGLAGSLNLIALILGGLFVIQGKMTLGDLIAFNGFLWMLNQPMRMSGWLINDVQRFSAACIKIRQMLNTEPQIPVVLKEHEDKVKGFVEFKHVSFHFSDDPHTQVLKDVSFKISPGQTIGILGETGSGKTTLVNLVGRFYDPTQGEVLIDGKNVKDYPVRQLRENISMVMQDVFLFSNTIEDNIAFGNPFADESYVQRMAQIADAHEFISRMPEGYATIVGERGVGLSGGQKQRISLARALTKDPSILILDDTTSAVDMETESKIQRELTALTEAKTTFIIAHRISSVREADLILMMEKGQVVEQGTHKELVEKKGLYYEVYQKQLGLENGEVN
ncbi:ABC transporter ATP-binding/permease [Enterococcus phoeniculicola]|jgi:ATP-binding cassette subfamily B multidrug efflux pump|uniref:ABC transporter ATP-binding/permease n=1 Tax=Enterococcus phoeniculicola ATCC BAA-412 TaxID=1158610 RepID=R3WLW5_9ENTE|nr:ABC transporter ATP-binding protein [Enterococcus phoeniculicola]EOL48836.1 ABC transporter ATP-binding/permease [Enterococcus phoeniculicola ATCC BAA-412]EOT72682.1 ABC transporter ATP-binding/permease [Enterococcus phoeniculicola ATCC BAA-412]OJG71957.1 ABC transporter ATP-binding/permease [Enterococcus phoeniculicola]